MLVTLCLLIATAAAHSGFEYQSYARDARVALSLDQRLTVLRAMALGSAAVPAGAVEIAPGREGARIDVPNTEIFWSERDGRFEGYDTTATAALALSIVRSDPDRGSPRWDDPAAVRLIGEVVRIGDQASPGFRRAFWNSILLDAARAAYLREGHDSALALYARALHESLRSPKGRRGRSTELFGEEEGPNLKTLPELAFAATDSTRLMHLLLVMVDVGLANGLDAELGAYGIGTGDEAVVLGPRVRQLTPILRRLRDSPPYVRACLDGTDDQAWCELVRTSAPAIDAFLDAADRWSRLDDTHDVIPKDLITTAVSTAARVHAAVSSGTYAGFPRRGCARWLEQPRSVLSEP